MVSERLTDGIRIAQLLASEISGNEGRFRDSALTDTDPDVEPTTDGALAYRIVRSGEGDRDTEAIAEVYVQPDRIRIECLAAVDVAAAATTDLRVRPKAVRPPRTLVFVEDGAQVKRALRVLAAVVACLSEE